MNPPDRHPPMAPWLEQAWLMRYLDRQLGADEQAWFEGYLLDKPDLLDQVEADTALRDAVAAQRAGVDMLGAADLRTGTVAGAAGPAAQTGASQAVLTRIAPAAPDPRPVRVSWLALAASFVAGIGLAWIGLGTVAEPSAGLVANPTRIIFDTLRGELTAPRIEPGDPASPVMLVEFPVPPGARILSVAASVPQGDIAVDSPAIAADGYATYVVPAGWRGRGTLTVQIQVPGSAQPSTLRLPL